MGVIIIIIIIIPQTVLPCEGLLVLFKAIRSMAPDFTKDGGKTNNSSIRCRHSPGAATSQFFFVLHATVQDPSCF